MVASSSSVASATGAALWISGAASVAADSVDAALVLRTPLQPQFGLGSAVLGSAFSWKGGHPTQGLLGPEVYLTLPGDIVVDCFLRFSATAFEVAVEVLAELGDLWLPQARAKVMHQLADALVMGHPRWWFPRHQPPGRTRQLGL